MNSGLFTSLVLVQSALAAIPGRTLADCNAFADLFDNTCSSVAGVPQVMDLANDSGTTVNCAGAMRCPGTSGEATYTSESPCSYERKLCLSCYEDSVATVYIKVQSNALPNHCFFSTLNNAGAIENEWTVVFNADMSSI